MNILPIAIDKVNDALVSIKCNISTYTDFPDSEQVVYRYYVADDRLIGISSITLGLDVDYNEAYGTPTQRRISKNIDVPKGGHILYRWRMEKLQNLL